MASFEDTYNDGDEIHAAAQPYDNDGYTGYDFDLPVGEDDAPPPPMYGVEGFGTGDDVEVDHGNNHPHSPGTYHTDYSPSAFESNGNDNPYDIGDDSEGIFAAPDGPLLPEPSEMCEEGTAFREWRRIRAYAEEQSGEASIPIKQNPKPSRYHPFEEIAEGELIEGGDARLTPAETTGP